MLGETTSFFYAVIYKAQVKIKVGLSGIGVEIEIGIEIEPVQRRLIEGNYRIVCQVFADRLVVLTVFEGHRLFPEETMDDTA